MLVLCAVFARRLWRCAASRGEWREARAAPRVARTEPENALDEPAGAARAPCRLAHRLHAAVDSLVDGGQSHDCRSKPAGFVTPFTQSFFGFAFSFSSCAASRAKSRAAASTARPTRPSTRFLLCPTMQSASLSLCCARREPRHSLSPGNPVCTSRARVNRAPGPKLRVSVRVVWYC